jgi:Uma2 family endonuclease
MVRIYKGGGGWEPFGSQKLQAGQFNLISMQTTGTRHSRVYTTSTENSAWLYEDQHSFRPGYSCESEIIIVCPDISDSLDEGSRLDTKIIDFSNAFDLVPHDRLLPKIATSVVDSVPTDLITLPYNLED